MAIPKFGSWEHHKGAKSPRSVARAFTRDFEECRRRRGDRGRTPVAAPGLQRLGARELLDPLSPIVTTQNPGTPRRRSDAADLSAAAAPRVQVQLEVPGCAAGVPWAHWGPPGTQCWRAEAGGDKARVESKGVFHTQHCPGDSKAEPAGPRAGSMVREGESEGNELQPQGNEGPVKECWDPVSSWAQLVDQVSTQPPPVLLSSSSSLPGSMSHLSLSSSQDSSPEATDALAALSPPAQGAKQPVTGPRLRRPRTSLPKDAGHSRTPSFDAWNSGKRQARVPGQSLVTAASWRESCKSEDLGHSRVPEPPQGPARQGPLSTQECRYQGASSHPPRHGDLSSERPRGPAKGWRTTDVPSPSCDGDKNNTNQGCHLGVTGRRVMPMSVPAYGSSPDVSKQVERGRRCGPGSLRTSACQVECQRVTEGYRWVFGTMPHDPAAAASSSQERKSCPQQPADVSPVKGYCKSTGRQKTSSGKTEASPRVGRRSEGQGIGEPNGTRMRHPARNWSLRANKSTSSCRVDSARPHTAAAGTRRRLSPGETCTMASRLSSGPRRCSEQEGHSLRAQRDSRLVVKECGRSVSISASPGWPLGLGQLNCAT